MKRPLFSKKILLGIGLLSLLPTQYVWSDFTIEFTDGRQVTVRHYIDEGQSIKIYNTIGSISFSKRDIKQITEVGDHQAKTPRLETVSRRPAALSSTPSNIEEQSEKARLRKETSGESGQSEQAEKKAQEKGSGVTTEELEQLDSRYNGVNREFDDLWRSHLQQVNFGIPESKLGDNLHRIEALETERRELLKAANKVDPDRRPAWAQ